MLSLVYMYKINTIKRSPNKKKLWLWILLGIVVIVITLFILEISNTTSFFHDKTVVRHKTSGNQSTKGEQNGSKSSTNTISSNTGSQGTSSDTSSVSSDKGTNNTTDVNLEAPSGTFASNHHPNLSGNPAPNTLTSDCTTTTGAACQIVFTNTSSGVTKSLSVQTTDAGGSAYWSWKLQDIGLTEGTWHIKAVATLGNQTKTSTDAMDLEVKQ